MRLKEWLKFLFSVTLPTVCAFLGQSNITNTIWVKCNLKDFIIFKNTDILFVKDCLTLIGIVLTIFPLGILYISNNIKYTKSSERGLLLIRYIKDILIEAVESKLNTNNAKLNVRIFVPKNKVKYFIYKILFKVKIKFKILFCMKNIKGFLDDEIRDGLEIMVFPKSQGLVGLCYNRREIVYGENLKSLINNYNFDDYQKQIIGNTDFCICIPVINKNNKIAAIMTLDSSENITIGHNKFEVFNLLDTFRRRFQEELINLFE